MTRLTAVDEAPAVTTESRKSFLILASCITTTFLVSGEDVAQISSRIL